MKKFFCLLLLLFSSGFVFAETMKNNSNNAGLEEYFIEYPSSYKKQEKLVSELYEILSRKNIEDPSFVISIVYPEMLRYSQFFDFLETRANCISYVNALGLHDFSIGIMQMKPAFAEEIERQILLDEVLIRKYGNLVSLEPLPEKQLRFNRVKQLSSPECQTDYLLAFIEIYSDKFGLSKMEKPEQIKILSVLFNSGLDLNIREIEILKSLKLFPYGIEEKSRWNYTDLSLEFYNSTSDYTSQEF